jgi:tetratricopeptide (TPR) repeat protein
MSPTLDEALRHLDRVPASQHPALVEMLHSLSELMHQTNRPHAATLAKFLAARFDGSTVRGTSAAGGSGPPPPPESTSQSLVSTFPALLRRASAASALLHAHALIRRHQHLLPDRPVQAALRVFAEKGTDRSDNAHVIAALGLFDEDGPSQVAARSDWVLHLWKSGRRRRALHHARRALSLHDAVGDATSLAPAHLQLAHVLSQTGDLPGCVDVLLRANDAVDRTDGIPVAAKFALQTALIDALMELNRNREAMSVLDTAEDLIVGGGPRSDTPSDPLLEILLNRAAVSEELGAMSAAIRAYRRILDGPELPRHAIPRSWVTTQLASCLKRSGRRREAIRLLTRELEAAEQKGTAESSVPEHCALAWLLLEHDPGADVDRHLASCLYDGVRSDWTGLGQIFVIMGDLERRDGNLPGAADCYRYALYLAPGTEHLEQPERLPERAERVLRPRGGLFLPPADGVLAPLLARLRSTFDGGDPSPDPLLPELRIMARERLFHVTADRSERARLVDELAHRMRQALQWDQAVTLRELTVPVSEVLNRTRGPAAAAALLTEVLDHHERLGRLAEPELALTLAQLLAELPAGPQGSFDTLWHHRELRLENRQLSGIHRNADEETGQAQPIYEELLSLLTLHGTNLRLPDHRSPAVLAFDLHEEGKAQGMIDDLSRMSLAPPPHVPFDLFIREGILLTAQRRLAAGDRPDRAARWSEHAEQLTALHRHLELLAPDYVRLRRAESARLDDAVRLVEEAGPTEGMVLASYFVGEAQTFCFVLASGSSEPVLYRIPCGRAELHHAAEEIRRTVDGDRTIFPSIPPIKPRRPTPLPLEGLADRLLPFQDLLEGRSLLCVAPHGPLSMLPLGALRLSDGRFWAQLVALTYAPSVSALRYLRATGPARTGAALCVRVTDADDLQDGTAGFEGHSPPAVPGWEVTSLTGQQATPERVFAGLGQAGLAYIACHGYRDLNDPENSALMLSNGTDRPSLRLDSSSRQAIRMFLRARDLPKGGRMPDRVVLRACSAGWHEPEHLGEDFTGLPRALLREGTRTVVAPIWQVDRDSSAELLDHFTAGLMRGQPVWRALWDAQQRMLADESRPYLSHPYHWAAFVPLGDWS